MSHHRLYIAALFIFLFPILVAAQAPAPSKQAKATKKSSARSVADAVMAEKRQVAISLLTLRHRLVAPATPRVWIETWPRSLIRMRSTKASKAAPV